MFSTHYLFDQLHLLNANYIAENEPDYVLDFSQIKILIPDYPFVESQENNGILNLASFVLIIYIYYFRIMNYQHPSITLSAKQHAINNHTVLLKGDGKTCTTEFLKQIINDLLSTSSSSNINSAIFLCTENEILNLPASTKILYIIDLNKLQLSAYSNALTTTAKTWFSNSFYHLQTIAKLLHQNPHIKTHTLRFLCNKEAYKFKSSKQLIKKRDSYHKNLMALFTQQVEINKNKAALISNAQVLSYAELEYYTTVFAKNISPYINAGSKVGILIEDEILHIINIITILKVNCVYASLDVTQSKDYLYKQIETANIEYVIAINSHICDLSWNLITSNNVCKQSLSLYKTNQTQASNNALAGLKDLAYIMFTSGSTGEAKGVLVNQHGIINLVKNTNYINITPNDKILQSASFSFDATTFTLWGALLNGASLYIVNKAYLLDPKLLRQYLFEKKISIVWLTAKILNLHINVDPQMFRGLHYLIAGGEVLDHNVINVLLKQTHKPKVILNGYGPTENTTFSTTYQIQDKVYQIIPIGKPITGTSAYIIDKYNNIMPRGICGEILLGGLGLACGYLTQGKLTQDNFISIEKTRYFKSGDLGFLDIDNNIIFLGRNDNLVKIRGYRVNCTAIESVLLRFYPIKMAMVYIAYTKKQHTPYLQAIVQTSSSTDAKQVRFWLKKHLPNHMIPQKIIFRDRFPFNNNGKINRILLKKEVELCN